MRGIVKVVTGGLVIHPGAQGRGQAGARRGIDKRRRPLPLQKATLLQQPLRLAEAVLGHHHCVRAHVCQ